MEIDKNLQRHINHWIRVSNSTQVKQGLKENGFIVVTSPTFYSIKEKVSKKFASYNEFRNFDRRGFGKWRRGSVDATVFYEIVLFVRR